MTTTTLTKARRFLYLTTLAAGLWFTTASRAEPITVNSLQELLPYLKQSNVELKMEPGTYTVTAKDAKAGKFGTPTFQEKAVAVFLIEGSGNTYDFTDVTINIETKVYSSLGKFDVRILQTQGNRNVVKNLTLHDVGSHDDAPATRATNIVMDGKNNRIEGLTMTVKGAYPYGYGELFGKGGKNVIRHRKHSALLIRGESNHVLNCTIDHQSYGHAIFMQSAMNPLVEGCTVQGVMRNTNEILAERGTGSPADKVNFMTYFGYRVPPNYMFSLGEAGIRAYRGGTTYIDGKVIQGNTTNPKVLNCTIKNMRSGVTLSQAKGQHYIEATTVLGCSRGFGIERGEIVDCYADVQYGSAIGLDKNGGVKAEITLLPHEGETINASGRIAYIIGANHQVVFHSQIENPDQDYAIYVGGSRRSIGTLADKKKHPAKNIQLNNNSGFRVILDRNTENCTVQSVGKIKNNGKNNHIKKNNH